MTDSVSAPAETPQPQILSLCRRCRVEQQDVRNNMAVISPAGCAHYGLEDGTTVCGIDATGDGWWWPL